LYYILTSIDLKRYGDSCKGIVNKINQPLVSPWFECALHTSDKLSVIGDEKLYNFPAAQINRNDEVTANDSSYFKKAAFPKLYDTFTLIDNSTKKAVYCS